MLDKFFEKLQYHFYRFYYQQFRKQDLISANEPLLHPHSVAVLMPDRLGEIILSLAAVQAIQKHYNNVPTKVIVTNKNYHLLKALPLMEDLIQIPSGKAIRTLTEEFKKHQFSIFLNLARRLEQAPFVAAMRANIPIRVGWSVTQASPFLNVQVAMNGIDENSIAKQLRLLNVLGIKTVVEEVRFSVPDSEIEAARRKLKQLSPARKFLAISLEKGYGGWQLSSTLLRKMLHDFAQMQQLQLVVISSEAKQIARLKRKFSQERLILIHEPNLLKLSALLAAMGSLVAPNNDLFHLANALSIRTLGIFKEKELHSWKANLPQGSDIFCMVQGKRFNINHLEDSVLRLLRG